MPGGGYGGGGGKYLRPYSSAEHVNGALGLIVSVIFLVFVAYVVYRVRKSLKEDEAYLRKKRERVAQWVKKAEESAQRIIRANAKKKNPK